MFSDPESNISQLGLSAGAKVADLGSGSGFYTFAASKAVGDTGRVYAVDVQKDLLEKLKNNAHQNHLLNIEVLWGNIEALGGSKLREISVDVALACNILFQLEDKNNFVLEAKRILKPGGRILVVDWMESFGGMGPQPGHVFNRLQAEELFKKNGFIVDKTINAGAHHYGLVFKKQ